MKYRFSHFGVSIPKTLNNNLNNWIQKYLHFNGLKFRYKKESAYDYGNNIIYIGKNDKPIHTDFRQFIYEYNCHENASNQTLTFLHELGHVLTNCYFNDIEMIILCFEKESVDNAFDYWHIDDEFEANMFVINFMNNNPEAIRELDNIFEGWM